METLILNRDTEKIFKLYADDGTGLVQDLNLAYAYLNIIEQHFFENGEALVFGDNDDQDLLHMFRNEQLIRVLAKIPEARIKFEGNEPMLVMFKNLTKIIGDLT